MPQLDFSTLSSVLFNSLLIATIYYSFVALQLLPDIITVFKFRYKKLLKKNLLSLDLIFLPNFFSYNNVIQKNNNNFYKSKKGDITQLAVVHALQA